MKGFLLAAGLGTRLWPLSNVLAKPAFPVMGKPLVRHVAELMYAHGVRDFVVNTHHLPHTVREAIGPFAKTAGVSLHLEHEAEILGTAGALVNLRERLAGDEVIAMNAKVVTQIDLSGVLAAHRASGAVVTMVCVPNSKREKFTHVERDASGALRGFVPADALATVAEPLTFTGIQVLSPEFFEFLPAPGFSDTIKDVYPRILAAKKTIHVALSDAAWSEFSTLARYRDLHTDSLGAGASWIDPTATVAGGAVVTRSVVWAGATVPAGAQLDGCIVADGVVVPDNARWKDLAVIQAERVPASGGGRLHDGLLLAPIGG